MAFSSIARSNFSHRPPTVPNDSQMTRRKAKIALLVIWHSSIGPSVLLASCCVKIPQLMKFPPSTTRKWATNWRKCRKILKVIVMALTTLSFFGVALFYVLVNGGSVLAPFNFVPPLSRGVTNWGGLCLSGHLVAITGTPARTHTPRCQVFRGKIVRFSWLNFNKSENLVLPVGIIIFKWKVKKGGRQVANFGSYRTPNFVRPSKKNCVDVWNQ